MRLGAPLELCKLHEDDLHEKQGEGVHPVFLGDAQWGDEAALPGHDLVHALGNDTRTGQDLGGNNACCTKHRPAGMDHLPAHQVSMCMYLCNWIGRGQHN